MIFLRRHHLHHHLKLLVALKMKTSTNKARKIETHGVTNMIEIVVSIVTESGIGAERNRLHLVDITSVAVETVTGTRTTINNAIELTIEVEIETIRTTKIDEIDLESPLLGDGMIYLTTKTTIADVMEAVGIIDDLDLDREVPRDALERGVDPVLNHLSPEGIHVQFF